MLGELFNTLVYNPLYNALVALLWAVPGIDVGGVVIILTLAVRVVLFPISKRAVVTQMAMRAVEPEMRNIREKYKDDKQKQGEETLALYRKHRINPFSSIGLVLLQLPIIFGLYFIFLRGGLPTIDTEILYPFVRVPESAAMTLFGFFDISGKRNIVLAVLVSLTQFLQAFLSSPKAPDGDRTTFSGSIAHSMHLQMRYVFPVIIGAFSYSLSALIALYWTASNVFTIAQEVFVRRRFEVWEKRQEKNGREGSVSQSS